MSRQLAKGLNITHLLLDGFSCMDGIHNLSFFHKSISQDRSGAEPISTIAFRRCRFDLIGHFIHFDPNWELYPHEDCIFEPLTAEYTAWTFNPSRILRLHQTSKQLRGSLARELDQCFEPLPQNLLDKVASKAIQLPAAAQLRWKRELKRYPIPILLQYKVDMCSRSSFTCQALQQLEKNSEQLTINSLQHYISSVQLAVVQWSDKRSQVARGVSTYGAAHDVTNDTTTGGAAKVARSKLNFSDFYFTHCLFTRFTHCPVPERLSEER
ncbi:hypothetical protein RvY_15621-1 [Ramazzottius varieornatus]|uniref:Uncharacterized protein n=1 Tax=Ramazzottius varieornatus TaxID=947166 RepID=A0A1D1VVK1_RAMVA|nr:hypothetical protein RvY_15621-1 [Ramazzottius varieornatus]